MKTIKNLTLIFTTMFMLCAMLTIDTSNVYAQTTALTEEEVRTQAIVHMEKEKKRGDEFAVSTYNISEIYTYDALGYIIHDYRDGKTVTDMVNEFKTSNRAIATERVDVIRTWKLPYKNTANQNCIAIFHEQNGVVSLVGGELDVDSTFNMKLQKGKYRQISMEKVEEVRYIDLYLYHMMVTYIRMNDGTEYIIPFLNENIQKWNDLKDGAVYEIDKFFDQMYSYYDEPTKAEIQQQKEEYQKTGVAYLSGGVGTREVPLHKVKEAKMIELEANVYGWLAIGAAIVLAFLLLKWHREKKTLEQQ